jgi:hypothetical protein
MDGYTIPTKVLLPTVFLGREHIELNLELKKIPSLFCLYTQVTPSILRDKEVGMAQS